MTERDENRESRSEEKLRDMNSRQPMPNRGEDSNLDDVDPEHRNKAENAFKDQTGKSKDNNEDSRIDTDAGSRHGMGNKQ